MAKRNLIWLVVIVVIVLGLYQLAPMTAQQDSVYRTYAPLVEVDTLVHQKFVEPIEDDRLLDGAIQGMMLELDPYSGYIGPDELASYRRRAAGKYIGIGVRLGIRDRQLTVIAPIEQTPAMEAGIQAGDAILAINGTSTKGIGVADADRLLEGDPGSSVELKVRRAADGEIGTLTVTRARVDVHSVKGFGPDGDGGWDYIIEPASGIAYLRVSNFHENTSGEFDAALDRLRSREVLGLILDLRSNPGGALRAAVAMVDRFIESGVIVSTVTRHRAVDTYKAQHEGTLPRWPMAVLIDGGSASASEIVAGALQDHKRAVVVGVRSFGKGVVQNVIPLSGHSAAISLTVAHYRLPGGRIIHKTPQNRNSDAWGVAPDLVVELSRDAMLAVQQRRNLLDRQLLTPTTVPSDDSGADLEPRGVLIDTQLHAALEAVRGRIAATRAGSGTASRPTGQRQSTEADR